MKTTAAALSVFLVGTGLAHAQIPRRQVPFDPKAYSPSNFQISRQEYPNGEVTIRVIEAKSKDESAEPHYCRAWLEVRKGNSLVKQFYYDDIEPVGYRYGIFVPKGQLLQDFIAVKEGDYDGRLLLVGKDGSFADLPGGSFFLTSDRRYVVIQYSTDDYVLVVVEAGSRRVVIDSRKGPGIPAIMNWYRDAAGYFFTEAEQSGPSTFHEKKGYIYRLDLRVGKIVRASITDSQFAQAHKVAYDFDSEKKADCTATPQ